ncbi:MAG: prepilin-type N-terminal cleavage/methylation domain-containing protein [Candidatus Saganbacteria bacterium]|nr:prepilin-type N-terminal cleavage/methylation domain-containing protein [Candidatus Saganbacteria bacterium]
MSRRGFTLIELLLAASLFVLAVFSFSYLLKIGASSIASSGDLHHATYALQTKMEETYTTPFNQLGGLDGSTFADGSGEVFVTPVLADLVKIELRFSFDPNKVPAKITTLRSSY